VPQASDQIIPHGIHYPGKSDIESIATLHFPKIHDFSLSQCMSKGTEIGWFINEWMAARAMRQRDLMTLTGLSRQNISDLCSGKTKYTQKSLESVARALAIQPYELLLSPTLANRMRVAKNDDA